MLQYFIIEQFDNLIASGVLQFGYEIMVRRPHLILISRIFLCTDKLRTIAYKLFLLRFEEIKTTQKNDILLYIFVHYISMHRS